MTRPSLARRAFTEGLATFALVFAACGAILVDSERGGSLGANGIALAFGLVLMAMVYATGHLTERGGDELLRERVAALDEDQRQMLREARGGVGAGGA